MNVGQLRKELEGVADDVSVVVISNSHTDGTRLSTSSAFCVGNHTDDCVGAFAIQLHYQLSIEVDLRKASKP